MQTLVLAECKRVQPKIIFAIECSVFSVQVEREVVAVRSALARKLHGQLHGQLHGGKGGDD